MKKEAVFIATALGHVATPYWSYDNYYSRFIITLPQNARPFKFRNKETAVSKTPRNSLGRIIDSSPTDPDTIYFTRVHSTSNAKTKDCNSYPSPGESTDPWPGLSRGRHRQYFYHYPGLSGQGAKHEHLPYPDPSGQKSKSKKTPLYFLTQRIYVREWGANDMV